MTVSTSHGHTAVIHTTSNHPFWDNTTHTWVAAGKLKPGDQLNSTGNQHPTVITTKPTPGAANRWNLTIQQLHTYYVLAGATPILVHNTDEPDGCSVVGKAMNMADKASSMSNSTRPGTAEVLQTRSGGIYSSYSFKGGVEPELDSSVDETLRSIPQEEMGNGHGRCGLPVCISEALAAGDDPSGGRVAAVSIMNNPESPLHGNPVPACASCESLVDEYDLDFVMFNG